MLIWENSIIWTLNPSVAVKWDQANLASGTQTPPTQRVRTGAKQYNCSCGVQSMICSLISLAEPFQERLLPPFVLSGINCISIALIYFDSLFLPGYIRSVANSQDSSCNIPFGTWKLPALKQKFAPGWATGGAWLVTQTDDQYMAHIGPIYDPYVTNIQPQKSWKK